eukprot:PhM_4_TR10028/c0_g4_i1/m.95099/K03685/rnc, DROSHA, RNT1; ribonuclease III
MGDQAFFLLAKENFIKMHQTHILRSVSGPSVLELAKSRFSGTKFHLKPTPSRRIIDRVVSPAKSSAPSDLTTQLPVALPPTWCYEVPRCVRERLNVNVATPILFQRAFIHESFCGLGEHRTMKALHPMGDAVLHLATESWVKRVLGDTVGIEANSVTHRLLSREALQDVGSRVWGLHDLILTDGRQNLTHRRVKSANSGVEHSADMVRAVFGAVYIDCGLDVALRVLRDSLECLIASSLPNA